MSNTTKHNDIISFRVGSLKDDLIYLAKKRHISLSALIKELLENGVRAEKKAKPKNFLTKYRGVNNTTAEETEAFIAEIRENAEVEDRYL